MKINKFSQINLSKVISTNKIQKLKPDLCIILAYLHNKSIIKKYKVYFKRSGFYGSIPRA